MKKATLIATIGAMALGVHAGDWGKAVIPSKHVIEDCVDVGGEISAGYMTDYIFHGVRFARDSVWTDVNYTFDNLVVPINIGAWYLNGITPANYDELNLYASAELGTFAGFDVELGYTHYFFPEIGSGNYGEIGLGLSRDLGIFEIGYEVHHAFGSLGGSPHGWCHKLDISREFPITDAVSLVASTGVVYTDGYWAPLPTRSSGWTNYHVTLELPIALNCRATLTPYIAYNGAPRTWLAREASAAASFAPHSDILHGGVSLSVSF